MIGESGSGKTTLATALEERGFKQLWSYTTRPPRYENEPGHIFVNSFPDHIICAAHTVFNGYVYWSTTEQLEENDVYVIDPAGMEYLLKCYNGNKIPIIIYVEASKHVRSHRMKQRGDSRKQIKERLKHDELAFRDFRNRMMRCDLPFQFITLSNDGDDLDNVKQKLFDIVDAYEAAI